MHKNDAPALAEHKAIIPQEAHVGLRPRREEEPGYFRRIDREP